MTSPLYARLVSRANQNRRRRPSVCHGFSLIEMLVVVAIIGILSVLVIPAFTGIGRGQNVTTGGNKVVSLASAARQNSLTKNTLTALVMITSADGQLNDSAYRVFGLWQILPHGDGTPVTSVDWTPVGNWESLPDGVVGVADATPTFALKETTMNPPFPEFTFRGNVVSNYQYIVFLPSGGLMQSQSAHLRIAAGFRPGGGSQVVYTSGKTNSANPSNYYDISIVSANGRIKVDRP